MDATRLRHRPLAMAGTAVACLVALIVLYFVWRIFFYYRLIKSGAIVNLPQYSSSLTLGNFAPSQNAAPVADVVTADDPSVGPATAPVTIVEFADFQCPFSHEVFPAVRSLIAAHPSDVRVVFRDFPLDSLHPQARAAAAAANCAAAQGKFLAMHDKLYQNADRLTANDVAFYAEQIGLDAAAFQACLADPATAQEIDQDIADGRAAGVRGTPTFFINGARVEGAIPATTLNQVVDQIISQHK